MVVFAICSHERIALKHVYYHVKEIASPGSMHEAGRSGLVHWDDPERWDGEGGGWGFRMGTHVHPWWVQVNVWQNDYNILK